MPKRKRKAKSQTDLNRIKSEAIIDKLEPIIKQVRQELLELGFGLEISTERDGTFLAHWYPIPRRIGHKPI